MDYDDNQSRDSVLRSPSSAVDLAHLRCAVAAADHGSFRRAADALRLRQSTLSRCVRRLEELVGMTIFERSSGGVVATPSGRDFLRMARSILEQMEALTTFAHSTGRGTAGRLAIGFFTSLSAGNLRATLADFRQRFPHVELAIMECSQTRLVTALRNGTLDVAIVAGDANLLEGAGLSLWSERIMVALPQGHQLADRDTIYWTDLRSETVLLSHYDPGRELENLLMAKLVSPSDRPQIARHNVSRGIIKSLITVGFGVSLVTESDIGANFSGLIYREIRDGTGPSRIGYSAHCKEDNNNPALAGFLKMLSERFPFPTRERFAGCSFRDSVVR